MTDRLPQRSVPIPSWKHLDELADPDPPESSRDDPWPWSPWHCLQRSLPRPGGWHSGLTIAEYLRWRAHPFHMNGVFNGCQKVKRRDPGGPGARLRARNGYHQPLCRHVPDRRRWRHRTPSRRSCVVLGVMLIGFVPARSAGFALRWWRWICRHRRLDGADLLQRRWPALPEHRLRRSRSHPWTRRRQ